MKFLPSLLLAVTVLAFNGCEKQPYAKIESMMSIHKKHGAHGTHGEGHGDAHGEEKKEKAEGEHAAH